MIIHGECFNPSVQPEWVILGFGALVVLFFFTEALRGRLVLVLVLGVLEWGERLF